MEQLEKYFDTAFGAPNGLIKLRELIITLAMQGKLTSKYPNDGTAIDLLDEIAKEKRSKIQIGEFKNDENETEYFSNISFHNHAMLDVRILNLISNQYSLKADSLCFPNQHHHYHCR